ncbi:MAG: LysE family transporter, partial [Verrucomicrobiaceae bacterium]|nr:LysE family transporter [Verrucomicrobiaceae bacterium]
MSLVTLYLYLATWTLVALSPGPAAMCVMTQAARHGVRASVNGIAGIQAGNGVFFICIACGLASLLATATTAFLVLRVVGALYLLCLGVRVLAGTFRVKPAAEAPTASAAAARGLFMQGLLIQLTNPKALLFVSALLPQFIDAGRPLPLQITLLALITVVVDVAVMLGYALLAAKSSRKLQNSPLMTWIERAFGAAMVFFGVRLLMTEK